jgi:hypothetical protein
MYKLENKGYGYSSSFLLLDDATYTEIPLAKPTYNFRIAKAWIENILHSSHFRLHVGSQETLSQYAE